MARNPRQGGDDHEPVNQGPRDQRGYRPPPEPGRGPRVRTDVINVYIVRRNAADLELLQIKRARDPLKDSWQPVMGHIEPGETAPRAAAREMNEEVGLSPADPRVLGFYALEQVHPFYIAAIDSVVMSPRFVAEVDRGWEPTLNAEHTAARWVQSAHAERAFMWPGQLAAIREITALLTPGSPARDALRIRLEP